MTESKLPLKVFMCHSSADKSKIREVYRYLKQHGVQPWLDAEELLPGQDWNLEISKALDDSDAIIIFLSKGSISKEGYVQREVKFALDRALDMPEGRIFVIPARLEPCDLPRSLSKYQWVDLFEDGGVERLIRALKARGDQLQRSEFEAPDEDEKPQLKIPFEVQTVDRVAKSASKSRKMDTAIVVALIGVVGTIIAALLGSPLIEKWLAPAPVPTATVTMTAPAAMTSTQQNLSLTDVPSPTPTETIVPSPTTYPTQISFIDPAGNPVDMRLVPAGSFTLGSNIYTSDERPAQTQELGDFYMDTFEVTNKLYAACGNCTAPAAVRLNTRDFYYGNSQYYDFPVVHVNWNQANQYCAWRGAGFRLPTEFEWEKAARGPNGNLYPWGNGPEPDKNHAQFGDNSGGPSKVGTYPEGASVYGIMDMAGNVLEWVSDSYDVYPRGDAQASADFGSLYKVLRGGSWKALAIDLRSSARNHRSPDYESDSLGFRCVMELP